MLPPGDARRRRRQAIARSARWVFSGMSKSSMMVNKNSVRGGGNKRAEALAHVGPFPSY
jgi:hypothetical protein